MLNFIENYKQVNEIKKEMDFFTYDEYLKFDSVIKEHEWHTFFEILYFLRNFLTIFVTCAKISNCVALLRPFSEKCAKMR